MVTILAVLLASTMVGVVSAEDTGRDVIIEESAVDDVDDLGGIFTKEECEAAGVDGQALYQVGVQVAQVRLPAAVVECREVRDHGVVEEPH